MSRYVCTYFCSYHSGACSFTFYITRSEWYCDNPLQVINICLLNYSEILNYILSLSFSKCQWVLEMPILTKSASFQKTWPRCSGPGESTRWWCSRLYSSSWTVAVNSRSPPLGHFLFMFFHLAVLKGLEKIA